LTNPFEEEEPELVGNVNFFNPYIGGGASGSGNWACQMDGINVPCSAALGLLHSGGAFPASLARLQEDPNYRVVWDDTGLGFARFAGVYRPIEALRFVSGLFVYPVGESGAYIQRYNSMFRDRDVAEFFRRNGRCFNVLQRLFGERFDNFVKSINDMKFVDVRTAPNLMDKALGAVGIPEINEDGSLSPATTTFREADRQANAVTSLTTNTAYLFSSFFSYDSSERGARKVHEQFHVVISASHVAILRALGVEVPPRELLFAGVPEYTSPLTGEKRPAIPPVYRSLHSTAGMALTRWLVDGCK
jgi:hypothetical protein